MSAGPSTSGFRLKLAPCPAGPQAAASYGLMPLCARSPSKQSAALPPLPSLVAPRRPLRTMAALPSDEDTNGGRTPRTDPRCPACPFDGDLLRRVYPEQTAYTLQELLYREPAAPAGWAGVTALLACAGAAEAVPARWAENLDTPSEPEPYWSDPAHTWVWLPPGMPARTGCRPPVPGSTLSALVTRADKLFPDAAARLAAELDTEWAAEDDDDDLERQRAADVLQPRLWPALVAYAVSFATQVAERPSDRQPWHVPNRSSRAACRRSSPTWARRATRTGSR
jgi:hypothetical protein